MAYTEDIVIRPEVPRRDLQLLNPDGDYPELSKMLFNRAWEFSVSEPGLGAKKKWVYRDLHMTFNIEKTSEQGFANKARIEVFNIDLSQHTQNWKGLEVELKVGYGSELRRLFWGNVAYVFQTRRGPDIVTTFDLGDGERSIYTAYMNRPYPAQTPVKLMLDDCFKDMGLTPNYSPEVNITTIKNMASSLSGPCRHFANEICDSEGLQWIVQFGQAYISPKGRAFGRKVVAKIAQNSGMIGSPISGTTGTQIVKVTTLLDARIQPWELVNIESKNSNGPSGVFLVRRCVYNGDTHGSKWEVECETTKEATYSVV